MKGFALDKGQVPIHYFILLSAPAQNEKPPVCTIQTKAALILIDISQEHIALISRQLDSREWISQDQGFIYAFSPIVTGLPSTMAVVTVLPRVLATTRVLPDAEGVGFSRSISMQSLLSLISTVIAMAYSPVIDEKFYTLNTPGVNL
jgi:hypothetical protein